MGQALNTAYRLSDGPKCFWNFVLALQPIRKFFFPVCNFCLEELILFHTKEIVNGN